MARFTVGIDYSITSPAMAMIDHQSDERKVYLIGLQKKYKIFEAPPGFMIEALTYPSWTIPEERFEKLSVYFLESIKILKEIGETEVFIEGYSMGSKGRVFDIAEATSVLKYRLFKDGISYTAIAPTAVKKFATGKGNANKLVMADAFKERYGFYLHEVIGKKKADASPASDMVDAVFVGLAGMGS
jgi:Holliday junction resolvasome RuvABC endonuclease subunit